jgi:hypothetical protein
MDTVCTDGNLLLTLLCVCVCERSEIVCRPSHYVCCMRSLVFRQGSQSATSLTLTCACENPLRSAMSTGDAYHWYIHACLPSAFSILWFSIHCYLRYLFVLHGDESMQIALRADRGGVWQNDVFFLARHRQSRRQPCHADINECPDIPLANKVPARIVAMVSASERPTPIQARHKPSTRPSWDRTPSSPLLSERTSCSK